MPPADRPDAAARALYATCASGLDRLLADELGGLGIPDVRRAGAGASFGGGLEAGYRVCLGSRVASRVLMVLHTGAAASPEALYARVREVDWHEHLDVDGTLAVDLFTAKSAITHSRYGALKVKDAVVDQFRERFGRRPSVDRETPDLRVNVYLYRDRARVALDLSGHALHRRGYREEGGVAPLKENLAAALLLAAGWPALAEEGAAFADPLCGSGTLLIEAAMIACRRAPGLGRIPGGEIGCEVAGERSALGGGSPPAAAFGGAAFGFLGWKGHDATLWERLVAEARTAVRAAPGPLAGGDRDARSIESARRHAASAGVGGAVSFESRALGVGRLASLAGVAPGLLLTNPPYGERLAAGEAFYRDFGRALARHYDGWRCGVFTARAAPLRAARLALDTRLEVANGGIDCVYAEGRVPAWSGGARGRGADGGTARGAGEAGADGGANAAAGLDRGVVSDPHEIAGRGTRGARDEAGHDGSGAPTSWELARRRSAGAAASVVPTPDEEGERAAPTIDVEPFANRLRKNLRALRGWRRHEGIEAWRAYDADLPEFAVAIDVYDTADAGRHAVVQEYRAPASVNAALAAARLDAVVEVLPALLELAPAQVHVKVREPQRGASQYQRRETRAGVVAVLEERGLRLELNFSDYLDTGLFLDHRNVRGAIAERARGKRFLNLFAYTGAATVAAVAGGARASVSVDLSNRYCRWAERNLALNGADREAHRVVRADVLAWLDVDTDAARPDERTAVGGGASGDAAPFDLILLDPPTFSNSTDTERDWNVQRDHVSTIERCLARLAPGGLLIFSNNFRRFRLDAALAAGRLGGRRLRVEERSRRSLGRDFRRSPRIHRVWFIEHATASHD